MENSDKPLLLTNATQSLLRELPFGRPMYNGRHHIGIMPELCNRRVIWRFVYRGDGRPMFNTYYDEVRHFSHGFAAVRRGSKWHFISEQGRVAGRHRFLEAGNVNRLGQAPVRHSSFVNPQTKIPLWLFYTPPGFVVEKP